METTREPYRENPEREEKLSTSFVLGILSLVFLLISPQLISFILGVVGLSIGARDRKPGSGFRRAEAGWIMSLIGTVLSAFIILIVLILLLVVIIPAAGHLYC